LRYRTKILLLLTLTAIVPSAISIAVMYELSERFVFAEFQEKALSIATTAGALLDGDIYKKILQPEDEKTTEYHRERELVREARDANRREETYLKRIFTIFKDPANPNRIKIGVDPEEDQAARPGDVYADYSKGGQPNDARIEFDRPTVDDRNFSVDKWGRWLASTAPIKDSNGKIVAAVRAEFRPESWEGQLRPVFVSGVMALVAVTIYAVIVAVFVSSNINKPLMDLQEAVEEIGRGNFDTRIDVSRQARHGIEFATVARAVNDMAKGMRERDIVRSALIRFESKNVIDDILRTGKIPTVTGDRRRVTLLFSDIRGFSTLVEDKQPEDVVALLNEYFAKMVEVIFRNGGTLDKFIGDGIMVIFGAPVEDPRQEEHAVNTAIEMQAELRQLCKKWEGEGKTPFRIGVGIHTGLAIVGNIGSAERLDYTAVGDTVNLAARLESATRALGVDILISEGTYHAVRGMYKVRDMGEIAVKGRQELTQTFSVEE
jgi:adenylate cyclase